MKENLCKSLNSIRHTMNSGSDMVQAKHVSGRNIFWSTLIAKCQGEKYFEFLHYPLELPDEWHQPTSH